MCVCVCVCVRERERERETERDFVCVRMGVLLHVCVRECADTGECVGVCVCV